MVKVTTNNKSVLLTGDIEKEAEFQLLKSNFEFKSDILISPHHGSNTSSTYPFIKKIAADLVIHSTDRFNRWGFPKQRVIHRYNEMSYQQLSTGCTGMLAINLKTNEITKMRQKRRIWRLSECSL